MRQTLNISLIIILLKFAQMFFVMFSAQIFFFGGVGGCGGELLLTFSFTHNCVIVFCLCIDFSVKPAFSAGVCFCFLRLAHSSTLCVIGESGHGDLPC